MFMSAMSTRRRWPTPAQGQPASGRRPRPTSRTRPRSTACSPTCRRALGGLDALINNAGIAGPTGGVEDIEPADWRRCIDIDLTGQFLCARRAVPMLKAAGGGAIVNMSSAAGPARLCLPHPLLRGQMGRDRPHPEPRQGARARQHPRQRHPARHRRGPAHDGVIRARAAQLGVSYEEMEKTYLESVSLRRMVTPARRRHHGRFSALGCGRNVSGQSLGVGGNVEAL